MMKGCTGCRERVTLKIDVEVVWFVFTAPRLIENLVCFIGNFEVFLAS